MNPLDHNSYKLRRLVGTWRVTKSSFLQNLAKSKPWAKKSCFQWRRQAQCAQAVRMPIGCKGKHSVHCPLHADKGLGHGACCMGASEFCQEANGQEHLDLYKR
eukprot:1138386-Pelagomonas_calceolata.AAC.8